MKNQAEWNHPESMRSGCKAGNTKRHELDTGLTKQLSGGLPPLRWRGNAGASRQGGSRRRQIILFTVALFLMSTFCLASCQKSDAPQRIEAKTGRDAGSSTRSATSLGDGLRLKKYTYVDSRGTGGEAFSLLIPAGWQFSGGVNWVLDNPVMPATVSFTVRNPAGHEEFEAFPSLALFWTNNQMLLSMFPPGSRYMGAEVMPVAGPEDALTRIILPRFRGHAVGLKVLSVSPLPELAKELKAGAGQPGVQSFASAAKMRIEYLKDGTPMEEDIFAVVEGYSYPLQTFQGVATNTNWYVNYLFSYKAAKGKLAANATAFKAMTDSIKVSPQWFNTYNQVVDILVQNQLKFIKSMGELSRYISQTNSEMSDSMMQSYNERQKIYDRIGEKMSESIRGTDHYFNPIEGSRVELPSGYKHVWSNGSGEYILTDSPGYNPNEESGRSWQELERKP
ncbi:MAG: hypothetical protein LLG43_13165 [Deltaproteobacteria bacterium]|nr:hypothetical protein [Deltaproteobacteria bacterium]